jgi:hypothetical protein
MERKKNDPVLAAGLFKQDRKEAINLKCPKNFGDVISRTREPNRILSCPFLTEAEIPAAWKPYCRNIF